MAAGTVDAGLQYNYEISTNPSHPSGDDYSLYLNLAGVGYVTSSDVAGYANPAKITCGASTSLEFWADPEWEWGLDAKIPGCAAAPGIVFPEQLRACATYALIAFYVTPPDLNLSPPVDAQTAAVTRNLGLIVWVARAYDFGGWAQLQSRLTVYDYKNKPFKFTGYFAEVIPCRGCIFKWMTSIAQSYVPPRKEDLHDGSTYGATWTKREGKLWFGVPLLSKLFRCSEYPLWTVYNAGSADCKDTPANLTGVAKSVQVSNFDFAGETDVITLATPRPTPTPKPTATPTAKPKPTATPTAKPKPTATPTAKPKPTATPTAKP